MLTDPARSTRLDIKFTNGDEMNDEFLPTTIRSAFSEAVMFNTCKLDSYTYGTVRFEACEKWTGLHGRHFDPEPPETASRPSDIFS